MRPCQSSLAYCSLQPNGCTDCPLQGTSTERKRGLLLAVPTNGPGAFFAPPSLTGFPRAVSLLSPKAAVGEQMVTGQHVAGATTCASPLLTAEKLLRRDGAFCIDLPLLHSAILLWGEKQCLNKQVSWERWAMWQGSALAEDGVKAFSAHLS